MENFTVTPFVTGLENPRRLLVLPNNDAIVAEQRPGYLTLLRDQDGDGKADFIERYADDFQAPYGVAYRDGFILGRSTALRQLGLKMIEVVRENSNSTLDFATKLLKAKSLSEAVELSTAQTRKQYEAMKAQTKDLTTIVRKVAADTAEPVRESLSKVFEESD
jgi:hypothetical protein